MEPSPSRRITGRVQSGVGNAAHWLGRFNVEYSRKLGVPVFPGSLNLALAAPFDWQDPALQPAIIWFGREEYGGERDILMLPCRLHNLGNQVAFLWTTTTAAMDREEPPIIEIVAPVGLRVTYGLRDGDEVLVEVLLTPRDAGEHPNVSR